MENKDLDKIFKELDFNVKEPTPQHRERFLQKLNAQKETPGTQQKGKVRRLWLKISSVAASLLIAFFLVGELVNSNAENHTDLASISPEMKKTQEFYSGLIEKELNSLQNESSPETQKIIDDALTQLSLLEKDYAKLKKNLKTSGNDNRVIHAMIQNFQQRIDLLNSVLTQIENIKSLKNKSHENNII
ncbi:DUF4179 domain-containing protein [Christiangramia aquimixticola]|uniref:DUF4179 domain-containing protein n=1 Tax=Christiangramia aquimixticola TaxID=1697558 RepID=UPI003AA90262